MCNSEQEPSERPRPSEVMNTDAESDIAAFRGTCYQVRYEVRPGVTCHECGSGEVYQPLQTMDMPMKLYCLNCGLVAPSGEFRRSEVD